MDDARRCTAKSKRQGGERCKRSAILGGAVCRTHGGASGHVKAAAARRLLADAAVREYGLARAQDPDRVVAEIGCIAFVDLGDALDGTGKLLAVADMPPHVRAALSSSRVRRVNLEAGDGVTDEVVELKMWDKTKMLELLAKHHGLTEERVVISGSLSVEQRLLAGRKTAAAFLLASSEPEKARK